MNSTESATASEIEGGRIIYVPARILCFMKETIGGRVWAVVHSCQSAARTNSFLTRRWQLSYHANGKPIIRLVVATALACPVFIVEEAPGLKERKPDSDTVYEVSNRRLHWPKIFLHMANEGVCNFVPSRVKRQGTTREPSNNDEGAGSTQTPGNAAGITNAAKAKTKKRARKQKAKPNKKQKRKAPPPVAKTKRTPLQAAASTRKHMRTTPPPVAKTKRASKRDVHQKGIPRKKRKTTDR
jgi:hypothetical protein